jgi:hypothetical protein
VRKADNLVAGELPGVTWEKRKAGARDVQKTKNLVEG